MKNVLLIISGSIAAIKTPELIRALKKDGASVTCILTAGGAKFVAAKELREISKNKIYTELFSKEDKDGMDHIRLSREADLVVVAPASANLIAKMANGYADDLASTTLLASNKPILLAPAMNTMMWENAATQRNLDLLRADGVDIIEPESGELACGEIGQGRLANPQGIVQRILDALNTNSALKGKRALVTAGPTHEPIDPVRFIGNHSSGKQGIAIAEALARAGAEVTLVLGPSSEKIPHGVKVVQVHTAQEMLKASEAALPADISIFTAAVADWRASKVATHKMKKRANELPPAIGLTQNPDILKTIATGKKRPKLVIGFAAETEHLEKYARAKLKSKNADWIIANDVSGGKIFGDDATSVLFLDSASAEKWNRLSKRELAQKLVQKIIQHFGETHDKHRLKTAAAR